MKQELLLLLGDATVWSILAAVCALAPGRGMPGYARVWSAGAFVFDSGRTPEYGKTADEKLT